MRLEKLNFIHFFVDDKEYLMETDTIKYVLVGKNAFSVHFISKDIPAVSEFFLKHAEESFIFFFGNFETQYDNPVVSRTGMFEKTLLDDSLFGIQFSLLEQ